MATETRCEELRKQCQVFHKKYPKVWELFVRFTMQRIDLGFKHYSAYAIFERIRWETDQANVKGEPEFKLNNNYRPFYSRRFMTTYPQHEGFFRTREQTSKTKLATNRPELGPLDIEQSASADDYRNRKG